MKETKKTKKEQKNHFKKTLFVWTKYTVKRIKTKILPRYKGKGLKTDNFSLISNNCWGGALYDKYNLQYKSPTIGCFMMAIDYIKFLENLKYYLSKPLQQVLFSQSNFKDRLDIYKDKKVKDDYIKKGDNLIIGRLDDIEIIFYHSSSFQESKKKWDRRVKRLNYDRLIVKFNDQNGCTINEVKRFEKLPYNNKIFFTSNIDFKKKCSSSIYLKKYKKEGYVINDTIINDLPFNEKKYINKRFNK